jgi:hypothetical protein
LIAIVALTPGTQLFSAFKRWVHVSTTSAFLGLVFVLMSFTSFPGLVVPSAYVE